MTDTTPQDAEAFNWLDAYFASAPDETSPDEAFDWIYMMHEKDWKLLEGAWENRSSDWRESCAYILGEGPVPESIPVLQKALFVESQAVALEAACSYSQQRLNHGEEVAIDGKIVDKLRQMVEIEQGKHMEEVVKLLQQIDSNLLK